MDDELDFPEEYIDEDFLIVDYKPKEAKPLKTCVKTYLDNMGKMPLLASEYEKELLVEYSQTKNKKARDLLILSNLRLAVNIAKRYNDKGLDFEDLIQEATFGLIKSIEYFKPDKKLKLSTYATWWIKGYIERAIKNKSKSIRVPVYIYERTAYLRKISNKFILLNNREPSNAELAELSGISEEKVSQAFSAFTPPISLDAAIHKDKSTNEIFMIDIITDKSEEIIQQVEHSVDYADLKQKIKLLPALLEKILLMRYGLYNNESAKTCEQIGNELNYRKQYISELEHKAIKELRNIYKDRIQLRLFKDQYLF